MKFRYYIIDDEFHVTGTNDRTVAEAAADDVCCGVLAVINTETNVDLTLNAAVEITENTRYMPSAD